jgi:replicative DNA helicase
MEKLQGDRVFDERGEPRRVTFATEVQHDRTCYAVKFSDGSSLIADPQWTLIEKADGGRLKQHTVTTQYGGQGSPLERYMSRFSTDDLPVDPYVLGVWLGDGHTGDGAITSADEEVVRQVALHYEVSKRKHFGTGAG